MTAWPRWARWTAATAVALVLAACASLQVLAYEDGWLQAPQRRVQRIAAQRPPVDMASRYLYPGSGHPTPPAG